MHIRTTNKAFVTHSDVSLMRLSSNSNIKFNYSSFFMRDKYTYYVEKKTNNFDPNGNIKIGILTKSELPLLKHNR